ncbi:N-acetyltransferase DgcN [Psychromonas sp. Urea-02u-13]|uniref:N-acetyltransferase DgcN n=1 Tax=Psychromonas sp. Urea-02u-13 TaxID=2058326 RepID=UPI000C325A99|nr:N-acetyltransferase DgcN [Psychromonas sp. Urea-02u-13]PKG37997.1 DUF1611 domain-containing protein [Psychromonas sp. Urea-02u-13]
MKIQAPYLLFLGDASDNLSIKMAKGVADWRPQLCTGQFRLDGCSVTTGQPDMSIAQAKQAGAKTFVLGFANSGGTIDNQWIPFIVEALNNGFDIVSGLHDKLTDIPQIKQLADQLDLQLIDIRHPQQKFKTGTGEPRIGKRLITVGTDCSVGKMYTSLSLEKAMKQRGLAVDFRATGQCGILIAGNGVAIDCVVADFIAGASESLSPANDPAHWDIIEGQGSLFHPAFAGVSLGLLHGAQADAIVVCHAINRESMRGIKNRALPSIADTIALNVAAARVTNPQAQVVGITLNTSSVSESEALEICHTLTLELGLPCIDPIRHGVDAIIDKLCLEY